MRIAFVTLGFTPLRMSGLDVSGERLVQALLASGHAVTVVAGIRDPLPEPMEHPGLNILRIKLGATDWIWFAYRAAEILRGLVLENRIDIVHFWDVHFAWAYRGPFVASVQHSFLQRIQSGSEIGFARRIYYRLAMHFAEKPAVERATLLLGGSSTSLEAFRRQYGVPNARSMAARHGIDTELFSPRVADGLRKALTGSDDEPLLMFSGFVTPRKGLVYLIDAFSRFDRPPYLLVTGDWPERNRRTLLGRLPRGHRSRIIYVGLVPDAEMPLYYSAADLYVSASLLEGFGLPLAEALACGTAVVCADSGAAREVAGPGAIYVRPQDPEGLFQSINYLLRNPEISRAMALAGRRHVEANFTVGKMCQDAIRAYRSCLGEH